MPTRDIVGCALEARVPPVLLAELDGLMADPRQWPHSIWGVLAPRTLTPAARKWGATEVGWHWLADRGFAFSRHEVMRHYRLHVPIVATSLEELGAMALELRGNQHIGKGGTYRGAQQVVGLYDKAIALGIRSLDLLEKRLETQRATGVEPDPDLLLQMATLGARLAVSAATLAIRGGSPMGREDDPWEGARPVVGPRLAHGRMRVIDGVPQHIKDDGPADRAEYSERAAAEGRVDPFRRA